MDRTRQMKEDADYLGVKHLIKKFSTNANGINVTNVAPMSALRSISASCRKSVSKKKAAAMQAAFNKANHIRTTSDDSEDYDEYSGDDDEDNERYV